MGQAPKLKGFKGEEQFTSAILGVVNPKVPKIYFSTGHGEHDPDGMDADGYSQLKDALKRDNLDVEKTTLLSGAVPADCDLLVIAGPKAPFTDPEKAALKAYLDKGGRALVLLDPVLGDRSRSPRVWRTCSRGTACRSTTTSSSTRRASCRSSTSRRCTSTISAPTRWWTACRGSRCCCRWRAR